MKQKNRTVAARRPTANLGGSAAFLDQHLWEERFEAILNFEHSPSHNGIVIRKFFLHVSKKEQKRRFLERIERREKNWKVSASDVAEREHWDEYMEACQEMIGNPQINLEKRKELAAAKQALA